MVTSPAWAAGASGSHANVGEVAAVDVNFQLPFRRARIADANLRRIGADLVIERQGGHGGGDAWTRRQVDAAIDPARIHDVDGERSARSGRLEQQPDAVAA